MAHGRNSHPLRRKIAGSGLVGSPWKRLEKMLGFGLSALLRGSFRPCKVCNIFYAPLYYGVVPVEQKIFCGDQSQIFLVSCAIARVSGMEQIVCIIINLEYCSKLKSFHRKAL